jgi:hypothetical protein
VEVVWTHQADEDFVMTDITALSADGAAASAENRDIPIPAGAGATRADRARSTVYSIRLNTDEVAAVQALAEAAELPASTLVRSWIIERVRSEQSGSSDVEVELRAAQRHLAHVQQQLTGHAS